MNKFTLTIIILLVGLGALIYFASSSSKVNRPNIDTSSALQITEEDHVIGDRNADVVIVEYADYECPACAAYHPVVKEIANMYGDQIAIVFRHFPLYFHQNGKPAAWAAEAAAKQGQFDAMSDLIFANQSDWSGRASNVSLFYDYAEQLGLDMEQFRTDAVSDEIKDRIESDITTATALGVNSTPTFYLNENQIRPGSVEEFAALIDAALTEASNTAELPEESQAASVEASVDAMQGLWQSTLDPLSQVEITDAQYSDIYEGEALTSEALVFVDSCEADSQELESSRFFKVGSEMCYSLVSINDTRVEYTLVSGNGSILSFEKVAQ